VKRKLLRTISARFESGEIFAKDRAISLYIRAKKVKESIFSPNHPEVLLSRNNLANMMLMGGQYADAALEHEHVLILRTELYGADHLQTATSIKNLAIAQLGLGKFDDALRLHERALDIREQGYGEDHPKTAERANLIKIIILACDAIYS